MASVTDEEQTEKRGFPHDGKKFLPGQSGNPAGRPPGRISLPAMVRRLVEDPELVDKVAEATKGKDGKEVELPPWWGDMEEKSFASAITMAMMMRAVRGDDKAANWVRKTGYGDKIIIEPGTGTIEEDLDALDDQRDELSEQAGKALSETTPRPSDQPDGPPAEVEVVADDAPVQDQGQAGADSNVQTERNAATPPS